MLPQSGWMVSVKLLLYSGKQPYLSLVGASGLAGPPDGMLR